MAEAVVDEMPTKFFCHQCSREIDTPLLPDYKCPLCSSGFIEELMNDVNSGDSSMDVSTEDLEIGLDLFHGVEFHNSVDAEHPAHPLVTRWRRRRREMHERRHLRNIRLSQNRHRAILRHMRRGRRNVDDRTLQPPFESIIQEFIVNLTGMQGQHPFLFLENHGDYVWGREGLDAIVTQLLNQMDGTGPPPLPKKQIEEIPTIAVAQSHIDIKLQCSVCWEDFILSESVKQLPCQHLYHVPCIVPWLELHGTCPICRQSLSDQNASDAGNEPQSQDTVNLATIFSVANQTSSSSASSSNSTPTSTSSGSNAN